MTTKDIIGRMKKKTINMLLGEHLATMKIFLDGEQQIRKIGSLFVA